MLHPQKKCRGSDYSLYFELLVTVLAADVRLLFIVLPVILLAAVIFHILPPVWPQEGSGAPLPCNNTVKFRYQEAYIGGAGSTGTGTCVSAFNTCESAPTKTDIRQTTNINFHWECTGSFPFYC